MRKFKAFSKRMLKNNKGQGMVEYILLLVVVVAIVMAVKGQMLQYVNGTLMSDLKDKISGAMGTGQ